MVHRGDERADTQTTSYKRTAGTGTVPLTSVTPIHGRKHNPIGYNGNFSASRENSETWPWSHRRVRCAAARGRARMRTRGRAGRALSPLGKTSCPSRHMRTALQLPRAGNVCGFRDAFSFFSKLLRKPGKEQRKSARGNKTPAGRRAPLSHPRPPTSTWPGGRCQRLHRLLFPQPQPGDGLAPPPHRVKGRI